MPQPLRRQSDRPDRDPTDPVSIARRLAELRETAKRDSTALYLLPGTLDVPRRRGPRRLWLFIAGGGGLLGLAAIAVAMLSGGGGSGTVPPPTETAAASGGLVTLPGNPRGAAATATPTRAIPTPTPRSAQDAAREGAVPSPIAQLTPSTDAPPLVTPLKTKGRVLDHFGAPRGQGYVHAGIDATPGTAPFDVVAACDGTVLGVDRSATYGDYLVIDCGAGWRTLYANLSIVQAGINQTVVAGYSVVGVAQDFVHFEVRWIDTPLDPERFVSIEAGPPLPTPAPTVPPTSTPTPPPAATPAPGGATPGGEGTPAAPTATPAPPTATPTSTPKPTATPTMTPTPRPQKRPPTPPPAIG